jgi:hypothetical protein
MRFEQKTSKKAPSGNSDFNKTNHQKRPQISFSTEKQTLKTWEMLQKQLDSIVKEEV